MRGPERYGGLRIPSRALSSPARGPPGFWWAASASGLLLHPGLDLVEASLGAGFVLLAAALSPVCAAETDSADEIIAGHDRQGARPRENALVRLDSGPLHLGLELRGHW